MMKFTTQIFKRSALTLGLLLASSLPSLSWAQNAIQSVTGMLQGGSEVIKIDLAEPLAAVPTGFAIQAPARIALDIPGATNAVGRSLVEVNQGNLKSVNIVEAGERARLVLNLKQATTYQAQLQGRSLLVILEPVATVSVASAQQPLVHFCIPEMPRLCLCAT